MRRRYGTRFVVLAVHDRIADEYKDDLSRDDEIIQVPSFEEMLSKKNPNCNEIYDLARKNEKKYAINYMRDIIQLDRGLYSKFSGIAPNSIFGTMQAPAFDSINDAINNSFTWIEEILVTREIDLVLGWPLGLQEACCVYAAEHHGILVSYPYPAKLANRAFWASGPFTSSFQHREAISRLGAVKAFDPANLASPASPIHLARGPAGMRYSARIVALDVVRSIYEHLSLALRDTLEGRAFWRVQRASLRRTISVKLRSWLFYKRFRAMCVSDLDAISARPFVFYAFHQEPEFTVQGQSKNFNDQGAIVRQIAKSLPAGMRVVIKEHSTLGYRNLNFYRELTAFPNVIMADPNIPGTQLVERSVAVASLRGTVTLEAALFGKPALVFVPDTEFAVLSNTKTVMSLAELGEILSEIAEPLSAQRQLAFKVDGARFRAAVEEISFEADSMFSKSRALLPPDVAERAVELLVRLNNLFRDQVRRTNARQMQLGGPPKPDAENETWANDPGAEARIELY
jgi:hypothetical protein